MVALHLDYWHNQIKSQSHIFSPLFFAESVDFGIDNICVMCRSQIDFNSDLKSSFVKMSDLNLTIRFFPSQWRKTWILSSIKHEEMKTRGWWKSKITWSWIWIYDIKNPTQSCIVLVLTRLLEAQLLTNYSGVCLHTTHHINFVYKWPSK